jgi:hypothetical protein
MENGYFAKGTPLTIYRPALGAVTGQKTLPRQQHQRPGEEQQIEQVLRLIRHLQHDLANMRAAFHQAMRCCRFS